MSDIAIQVENLGKRYRIGGQERRYKRFTETMMNTLAAPVHRLRRLGQPVPPAETIWALKDVSFEVKEGEVVGIVGRNGAGKSTLLKVLSRITEPTEGEARVYGRVGSLLEVGTGFHPELTGRENIYLNGAILGMRKTEIERKFDEIVAFAELEQFIDTPVKRYSSGMYVRLAFAVAAHLEPEILVVDEVLAVGDVQFQKKCMGKMEDVAKGGRTVLFVSHNMSAITALCQRGILLDNGHISVDDSASRAVTAYLASMREDSGTNQGYVSLLGHPGRWKKFDGLVELTHCILSDGNDQPVSDLNVGETAKVTIGYKMKTLVKQANIVFVVAISSSGQRISYLSSEVVDKNFTNIGLEGEVQCVIPRVPLVPGSYSLSFLCKVGSSWSDAVYDAVHLEVVGEKFYPTKRLPPLDAAGNLLIDYEWVGPVTM